MHLGFLKPEHKKIYFFGEIIRKKIRKNFIANNNCKIISTWSLSSKWPVCRSTVNHTTGGRTKQNWAPCLQQTSLNIVRCFAIKWRKYTCNKDILSIQIMGKCIFVFFQNFFSFNWRAKLVIYFFSFFLAKQLRYATYGLKTCCSY